MTDSMTHEMDSSLQLLVKQFKPEGKTLWIVDEHGAARLPAPVSGMTLMTNRYDVMTQAQTLGWDVVFSDFDFSGYEASSFDAIYFRLAKEKPVVHYLINQAAKQLKLGGTLTVTGGKQEGVKTYAKSIGKRFGSSANAKKFANDYLIQITKQENGTHADLDDRDYTTIRHEANVGYLTKPGQYGWNKQDPGSVLLAENLVSILGSMKHDTILDIGCGYGYLSMMAAERLSPEYIIATDSNAAAVASCQANFQEHGISGEVVVDNVAATIRKHVNVVLCNPPFHQGFSVERNLTEQFVAAAQLRLKKNGVALFVVNSFITLERIAAPYFRHISTPINDGKFKLVLMHSRQESL